MDDPLLNGLQGIIQNVNQSQVVHQVVAAYDAFAGQAMRVLLEPALRGLPDRHYFDDAFVSRVAREAWALADAMMLERAKRGLGRLPESP